MSTLIFIVSLLSSNVASSQLAASPVVQGAVAPLAKVVDGMQDYAAVHGPMRYRGVERLLAKFEAEALAEEQSAH